MPSPGTSGSRYIVEQNGELFVKLPTQPWVNPDVAGELIPLTEFNPQSMLVTGDYASAFTQSVFNQLRREFPDMLTGGAPSEEGATDEGAAPSGFEETLAAFLAAQPPAEEPEDPIIGSAKSFYRELWGTEPPKGYVERYFKAGGDFYDFQDAELSRPAARKTNYYQERAYGYADRLASIFGRGF